MEFSNNGTSTYHRFVGHFVRDSTTLLRVSGARSSELSSAWSNIQTQLSTPTQVHGLFRHDVKTESQTLALFEKEVDGRYCGIAVRSDGTENNNNNEMDAFMSTILIKQARFVFDTVPSLITPDVVAISNKLTDMFDTALRYVVPGDMWKSQGREIFYSRIEYFVSRNKPIEFVLPAFPCKSSNTDKVIGPRPDKGEELALTRLHKFVAELEALYQPGGKLWIVSDGHVFSDCIGVDDEDVDTYTSHLLVMNQQIAAATNGHGRVGFIGLTDLFNLNSSPSSSSLEPNQSHEFLLSTESIPAIPAVSHHIVTGLTPAAESSREILMAGCGCLPSGVRARIDAKDPAILSLYRGFARFMLEDLDLNKATKEMSRSKKRKVSTKIGFEMILRNQAYSNLVELVFPHHVRLSIHAHNNSGPKFGIQLFDPEMVRVTDCLDGMDGDVQSVDLLHIPTPWHNSVVVVEGKEVVFVAKSKLARDAVGAARFEGGVEEGGEGGGACFRLRPCGGGGVGGDKSSVVVDEVEAEVVVVVESAAPMPVIEVDSGTPVVDKLVTRRVKAVKQSPVRPKVAVPSTTATIVSAAQLVSPVLARRGTLRDMDQDAAAEAGDRSLLLLDALADVMMNVVRANGWVWRNITGKSFSTNSS